MNSFFNVTLIVSALCGTVARAESDLRKFLPKQDVSAADAGGLFGRVSQKMDSFLTDCSYVPNETRTAVYQHDGFCNSIPVKFCFAKIKCANNRLLQSDVIGKGQGKTVERNCPAVDGKCPARPEDCMKAGGFIEVATGAGAIGSAPVNAPSDPAGTQK